MLAAPINAALFPDKGKTNTFNLIWNRPEPKASADVTAEAGHDDLKDTPQQRRGGLFARMTPTATL